MSATENHEVEKLVRMVKSESMVKGLIFGEDYYSTVNIMPHLLIDLKRFVVVGDGDGEGNHVYRVVSLVSKPWLNFVYEFLDGSKAVKQVHRAGRTMYSIKCPVSGCDYHSFDMDQHLIGKEHGEPWRIEDARFYR